MRFERPLFVHVVKSEIPIAGGDVACGIAEKVACFELHWCCCRRTATVGDFRLGRKLRADGLHRLVNVVKLKLIATTPLYSEEEEVLRFALGSRVVLGI